jgi:hypothetical protein
MLSTAELTTLEILSDRDRCERVSRTHLEKLSRLDLIEPCPEGVCLSSKGKQILGSR